MKKSLSILATLFFVGIFIIAFLLIPNTKIFKASLSNSKITNEILKNLNPKFTKDLILQNEECLTHPGEKRYSFRTK